MPCYLVVTLLLEDEEIVHRAAKELGLAGDRDYTYSRGTVTGLTPAQSDKLKQRYGVLKAETMARRKGYRVQRQEQQDGTVQVTVTR